MKFVLYRDKQREFRWRLVARNGRVMADSGEGYKTRRGRNKAIHAIRIGVKSIKFVALEGDYVDDRYL